ncbi:stage III sporulation protein AE, partial [Bacillus pumilus]|uniref:stage III sporulation protein AE n=1 Tax=Bacillus pumilus TaxID=1408 RepID=UPI003F68B8AD
MADGEGDALELHSISEFWERILEEYGGFLGEREKGRVKEMIEGDKELCSETRLTVFVDYVFEEVMGKGKVVGRVILVRMLCWVLEVLENGFEERSVSKVAYAVVYMVVMIIGVNRFHVGI